jgi:GpV Apex motif
MWLPDMSDPISDAFLALSSEIQSLRTQIAQSAMMAPVEVIDADKGYRLKLGENDDGSPVLSPYYPHPHSGKMSVPLKKGQVVGVIHPSGDPRRGFIVPGGYSDEHKSPNSDMNANVFEDAGVKISVADGALVISAGATTVHISSEGLTVNGGTIRNNDKDVGAAHTHTGVEPGGANTGGPA